LSFFTDTTTLILIVAALVSGSLLFWPMLTGARSAGITTTEAVRLINREKAVVIDVREPGEYAVAHVAGSRNVPLGRLEVAPELPKNKALPVILVCATGKRATTAAKALAVKGYTKAVVLGGGIEAWKTANLPIESTKAAA
jgi:rhodanese-related sulfurtransferase